MKARRFGTVDGVVVLGIVGSAIGFGVATLNDDEPPAHIAGFAVPSPSRSVPAPTPRPAPEQERTPVPSVDYASAYAALREDSNPKPRLQLIDRWARESGPGRPLDFLTQAMVDPDDSVRARAQELFDREVVRPR